MTKLINLAKRLGFSTEHEYFDYMIDSHVNGNFDQCRKLYNDMGTKDRKEFISHISNSSHVSRDLDDMYNFYIDYAVSVPPKRNQIHRHKSIEVTKKYLESIYLHAVLTNVNGDICGVFKYKSLTELGDKIICHLMLLFGDPRPELTEELTKELIKGRKNNFLDKTFIVKHGADEHEFYLTPTDII